MPAQVSQAGDPMDLVGLPWRLVPGEMPVAVVQGWTPMRLTLLAAWFGAMLAALAAAALWCALLGTWALPGAAADLDVRLRIAWGGGEGTAADDPMAAAEDDTRGRSARPRPRCVRRLAAAKHRSCPRRSPCKTCFCGLLQRLSPLPPSPYAPAAWKGCNSWQPRREGSEA